MGATLAVMSHPDRAMSDAIRRARLVSFHIDSAPIASHEATRRDVESEAQDQRVPSYTNPETAG